jgi:hypothetical protein
MWPGFVVKASRRATERGDAALSLENCPYSA